MLSKSKIMLILANLVVLLKKRKHVLALVLITEEKGNCFRLDLTECFPEKGNNIFIDLGEG